MSDFITNVYDDYDKSICHLEIDPRKLDEWSDTVNARLCSIERIASHITENSKLKDALSDLLNKFNNISCCGDDAVINDQICHLCKHYGDHCDDSTDFEYVLTNEINALINGSEVSL